MNSQSTLKPFFRQTLLMTILMIVSLIYVLTLRFIEEGVSYAITFLYGIISTTLVFEFIRSFNQIIESPKVFNNEISNGEAKIIEAEYEIVERKYYRLTAIIEKELNEYKSKLNELKEREILLEKELSSEKLEDRDEEFIHFKLKNTIDEIHHLIGKINENESLLADYKKMRASELQDSYDRVRDSIKREKKKTE